MANADFSKQSNTQGPRGFDSGSYREAKRADEDALHLTPAQQKLAVLENRLPTALRNRGAALALSIVVMLAAFFGLGGAKLKAKYNSASQWFSYGVAADNGYTLNEELLTRLNTAANVITTAPALSGPTAPRCRPRRRHWTISPPAWTRCKPMASSRI